MALIHQEKQTMLALSVAEFIKWDIYEWCQGFGKSCRKYTWSGELVN